MIYSKTENTYKRLQIIHILSYINIIFCSFIFLYTFLILCWLFLGNNIGDFLFFFEGLCLIFTTFLPMAIIVLWAKFIGTDIDISNKKDRPVPFIIGTISYGIGFLVLAALNAPAFITIFVLCYTCNTFIMLLISFFWKISIHTTGLIGPASALIVVFGIYGIFLGLILPILIWSRVIQKKHTMAQAVVGGVLAYILTIGELYAYMNFFNLSIPHIMPLTEVCCIALSLVVFPIILAILGALKDKGYNTQIIFIILAILAIVLFAIFAPLNALISLILCCIISLLITLYAGENFSWYRAIK